MASLIQVENYTQLHSTQVLASLLRVDSCFPYSSVCVFLQKGWCFAHLLERQDSLSDLLGKYTAL